MLSTAPLQGFVRTIVSFQHRQFYNFLSHESHELIEFDDTRPILINPLYKLRDLVHLEIDAEGLHGVSQLIAVDAARVVLVKEFEGGLNLFNLLFRKHPLKLCPSSVLLVPLPVQIDVLYKLVTRLKF